MKVFVVTAPVGERKYSNQDIVRKNQSITLEGLQPDIETVDQLIPNTEYLLQTHATYRMTGYNADENLILYSVVVRERTRGEAS